VCLYLYLYNFLPLDLTFDIVIAFDSCNVWFLFDCFYCLLAVSARPPDGANYCLGPAGLCPPYLSRSIYSLGPSGLCPAEVSKSKWPWHWPWIKHSLGQHESLCQVWSWSASCSAGHWQHTDRRNAFDYRAMHIDWKSWKLIAWAISPTSSLFAAKRRSTYSQGNMEKFWGH